MILLHRISYCRVGTRKLAKVAAFATDILGLEAAGRNGDTRYFRSDDRHHTLAYHDGDPDEQATGFEVAAAEFGNAAATLDALGHPFRVGNREACELRHVRELLTFDDPSGNTIELVVRPEISPRPYQGARDAGITGFSHVGLYSTDVERDERFWTQVCNARVSDRLGDAPLLRIDRMHHTIASLPRAKPGFHHINFQVRSTDDVQRSLSFLKARGVPIVFGPGRHPASTAQFLYFAGPDGLTFEYSAGVAEIADEPLYRERQLPMSAEGACRWGAKPGFAA